MLARIVVQTARWEVSLPKEDESMAGCTAGELGQYCIQMHQLRKQPQGPRETALSCVSKNV